MYSLLENAEQLFWEYKSYCYTISSGAKTHPNALRKTKFCSGDTPESPSLGSRTLPHTLLRYTHLLIIYKKNYISKVLFVRRQLEGKVSAF